MTTAIRNGARLTLAEFLELPEMERRCELIDGIVHIAADFPTPPHQFLASLLSTHLFLQISETRLGVVLGPAGVIVAADSAVGPDIMVIRAERSHIIGATVINGAPDIVVEILSSDRNRDLVDKRRLYQIAGIPEYWIVDGAANTLTILALGNDGIYYERATLTPAGTLTTPLFPTFILPLAQLFNHPARLRP